MEFDKKKLTNDWFNKKLVIYYKLFSPDIKHFKGQLNNHFSNDIKHFKGQLNNYFPNPIERKHCLLKYIYMSSSQKFQMNSFFMQLPSRNQITKLIVPFCLD